MTSRRDFFRAFTGKGLRPQLKRNAVEAYVRTHLLPYDFFLTDKQVEHLVRTVSSDWTEREGSEFSAEERQLMMSIAEATIDPWRDEYLKAEDQRRAGAVMAREFLTQADPAALDRVRSRFRISSSQTLEDEVEQRTLSWLCALPNDRLAALTSAELNDLVISYLTTHAT